MVRFYVSVAGVLVGYLFLFGLLVGGAVAYPSVSWVDVIEGSGYVVVSLKSSGVVDGVPVVVVGGERDVEAFMAYRSSLPIKIAVGLVGPVEGGVDLGVAYGGPGRLLSVKTGSGGVLVLGVGVDPEAVVDAVKRVVPEAGRVVIVNSMYDGSICDPSMDDRLEALAESQPFSSALLEVSCFPPAIALNATMLEKAGYTVEEVVAAIREAGVDGFYLILVYDDRGAGDGFTEYSTVGPDGSTLGRLTLAGAASAVVAAVLGGSRLLRVSGAL